MRQSSFAAPCLSRASLLSISPRRASVVVKSSPRSASAERSALSPEILLIKHTGKFPPPSRTDSVTWISGPFPRRPPPVSSNTSRWVPGGVPVNPGRSWTGSASPPAPCTVPVRRSGWLGSQVYDDVFIKGLLRGFLKVPCLIVAIDAVFCLNRPFWYRVCRTSESQAL